MHLDTEFEIKLGEFRQDISNRVQQVFTNSEPRSLYEPMRYAASSGGKLLRPVLLLLACEATGGKKEDALDAAVALEFVHNFTLVHDDIMDHDELRRGHPTVHKRWDENTAILAGDGLLVMAYLALGRIVSPKAPRVFHCFSQGIMEICEGQALDKEFEERQHVSLQEYFDMIDKKTARLFSVACEVGAILGAANEEQIAAMTEYGKMLGRAFQIQDDLLDVTAEQDVLGKDVGSDLEAHKKTFLMIYTQQCAGRNEIERLHTIINKKIILRSDIEAAIDIFTRCGTLDAAKEEINAALQKATIALGRHPESKAKKYLQHLLEIIEKRNS